MRIVPFIPNTDISGVFSIGLRVMVFDWKETFRNCRTDVFNMGTRLLERRIKRIPSGVFGGLRNSCCLSFN